MAVFGSTSPDPNVASGPGGPRSVAVFKRRARTSLAAQFGNLARNSAAAADTYGVAIEVPAIEQ